MNDSGIRQEIPVITKMLLATLVTAYALLSTTLSLAADNPAKNWLSIWSNANNQWSGGGFARFTTARILNPANPADPSAQIATVTVTFFQSACWGQVAAQESQTIAPGQFGSYSSLLAGYPESLAGTGCLWIHSDAPVIPVNGRTYENLSNTSNGESSQMAISADFWRAGKVPGNRWVSYWEHSVPFGGPEFGGVYTGGYVLNPARQKNRTETLPAATVTVTHYKGACGVGPVWRQDSFQLAAGQFTSHLSSPADTTDKIGQGCLYISSDQPIVAFNGALYTVANNPVSGQQSESASATTYQQVDW